MRILVGCECSGIVRDAFTALGHYAMSCDLKPSEVGGEHYTGDVFDIINEGWDIGIFHPPCTFTAGSGVQWLSHPDDKYLPFEKRRPHPLYPDRREKMKESVEFAKTLYNSKIKAVALENPVGKLSTLWRKPDQIIQPYYFGDEATKTTCLWLKNLPKLRHTNVVGKGERVVFKSGKSHPAWYAEALSKARTKEERQTIRSRTFNGIAVAMAQQWGSGTILKILPDLFGT
jgi:hypothetical protein